MWTSRVRTLVTSGVASPAPCRNDRSRQVWVEPADGWRLAGIHFSSLDAA